MYSIFLIISFFITPLLAIDQDSRGIENLVEIRKVNPRIRVELRYATSRNFAGKPLYNYPGLFVDKATAQALDAVQQELESLGYGLLIWDGFRSREEQRTLYKASLEVGGEILNHHVSNPGQGKSYKSTGNNVELTLVDKEGTLLEMPTDFDELIEQAHSSYMDLPEHVLRNRELLHSIMKKHDFGNFEKEWWYFYYTKSTTQEIYASAEDLKKLL